MRKIILAALIAASAATPALAWNVRSSAGATATVGPRYASRFQALIDDLQAHGARITFMGGIRPGRCAQDSKHPCGMALDVCQLSRGVVAHGQVWRGRRWPDCRIPSPQVVSAIAARHGLFSGGDWCDSDYGHFEAGGSWACGRTARRGSHHEEDHHRVRHARRGGVPGARVEASAGGPGSPDFH